MICAALFLWAACGEKPSQTVRPSRRVLVFTDSARESLPAAAALREQLASAGPSWTVEFTTRRKALSLDSLLPYSAVVLLEAQTDSLTAHNQTSLVAYVQAGGGLLALNSPLTRPYTWPWYEPIGMADTVPQEFRAVTVADQPGGGRFGIRAYDGGRAGSATVEADDCRQPGFAAELASALEQLAGSNAYDTARIRTALAPDSSRFTRWVLSDQLDEPMELVVMPDLSVIFIERRGAMKRYDPETRTTRVLATFEVCTTGNYEDGLLGITIDPDFGRNHYLYLYYSPPCDKGMQYLSRFTMAGTDSIILASEKVVLEVPVQRETCCHSGGSLAWGPDGSLYLSTGDNTSPQESDGYAPIDTRPGRSAFDAQKSSANTQDLRGKVLRIKPSKYGSYTIPDGNMFPKDGSQGRPEIYAMGMRNPFRISIDQQTGWLYWGDVGPDNAFAGKYGPETYDEVNQCRAPGFFGWPYFVGPNRAFRERDFAADAVGAYFDPAAPVNSSPFNTGAQQLPPAQPAFIYYPKQQFRRFPMLEQGSSSAMAGPVYHRTAQFRQSPVAFPDYFEGKLFIYEWARSWIRVVSMDSAGDLTQIEPFLPEMPLSKPIDMEFGPDGALYILEYGKDYFMKNAEARLVRITYAAGNRAPLPEIRIDAPAGGLPHTVHVSAAGSYDLDPDDSLRFEWSFRDSLVTDASGPEARFTYTEPGEYQITLRATDRAGSRSVRQQTVRVGNAPPRITVRTGGNQSFFFGSIPYEVQVEDAEDAASGGVQDRSISVVWLHADHPEDAEALLGGQKSADHAASLKYLKGWQLIQGSDCMSCHAIDRQSAGPAYVEVARRYAGQAGAAAMLVQKIYQGGGGNWGDALMPGHPQHTQAEIGEMVRYILSLSSDVSLPLKGVLTPELAGGHEPGGAYLLAVTYTDRGANGLPPVTSRKTLMLSHPRLEAERHSAAQDLELFTLGENRDIATMASFGGGMLRYDGLDLTGITSAKLRFGSFAGGRLIFSIDAPDGPVIGTAVIPPGPRTELTGFDIPWREIPLSLKPVLGRHDVFVRFEGPEGKLSGGLDWIEFAGK
jgi:cytochrome c